MLCTLVDDHDMKKTKVEFKPKWNGYCNKHMNNMFCISIYGCLDDVDENHEDNDKSMGNMMKMKMKMGMRMQMTIAMTRPPPQRTKNHFTCEMSLMFCPLKRQQIRKTWRQSDPDFCRSQKQQCRDRALTCLFFAISRPLGEIISNNNS